jgi:preprotein translocase SecE subunit
MSKIVNYFRESLEELHLVQWPTQQQSFRLTAIVLGFIIVNSVAFGFIDGVLGEIIRRTV